MNTLSKRITGRAAATAASALVLFSIALSLSRPAPVRADAGVPVPARPIMEMTGAYSKVSNRYYAAVTSEKEWERIWVRHSGQTDSVLAAGGTRLKVDFDRYVIVAVFQGVQPYNLGVIAQSVQEMPDKVVLRYTNRWVTTAGDAPAPTVPPYSPFGLFVIPRTQKDLVLEEAVYGGKGQPVTYTPRAHFTLPALH